MSELHCHFVKLNSTDFAEAPIVFYSIITIEAILMVFAMFLQPFVAVSIYRAGVMHRNFRLQMCLCTTYYSISNISRIVMLYYEMNDILPSGDDKLLFVVEVIRDAVLGYFCCLFGSFAIERYIATHYWEWYEKASPSTLSVLFLAEFTNLTPAVINSLLVYMEKIKNTDNFLAMATFQTISIPVFIRTYLLNTKLLKRMNKGATVGFYSVSRTFQVKENIEVMTYMYNLCIPVAIVSSFAFIAFGYKVYGPLEWRLSRNIGYALFDLFLSFVFLLILIRAVTANERILREFIKLPFMSAFREFAYKASARAKSIDERRVGNEVGEADVYFKNLQTSWHIPVDSNRL